jgi:hypothetical protein
MLDDDKEEMEELSEDKPEMEIEDNADKKGREVQDGESDTSEEFEEFLKGELYLIQNILKVRFKKILLKLLRIKTYLQERNLKE